MSCVRVDSILMSWEIVFIWLLQLAGWSEMLMFALFTGGPAADYNFPRFRIF